MSDESATAPPIMLTDLPNTYKKQALLLVVDTALVTAGAALVLVLSHIEMTGQVELLIGFLAVVSILVFSVGGTYRVLERASLPLWIRRAVLCFFTIAGLFFLTTHALHMEALFLRLKYLPLAGRRSGRAGHRPHHHLCDHVLAAAAQPRARTHPADRRDPPMHLLRQAYRRAFGARPQGDRDMHHPGDRPPPAHRGRHQDDLWHAGANDPHGRAAEDQARDDLRQARRPAAGGRCAEQADALPGGGAIRPRPLPSSCLHHARRRFRRPAGDQPLLEPADRERPDHQMAGGQDPRHPHPGADLAADGGGRNPGQALEPGTGVLHPGAPRSGRPSDPGDQVPHHVPWPRCHQGRRRRPHLQALEPKPVTTIFDRGAAQAGARRRPPQRRLAAARMRRTARLGPPWRSTPG